MGRFSYRLGRHAGWLAWGAAAAKCFVTRECEKADSTLRTSQAVPHPSTIRALCHLTSEVERDPVHLTWYGRQQFVDVANVYVQRQRPTEATRVLAVRLG